ncbi:MAG TPA: nucleoside hydrolase [Candidatus Limnocylindrales bacterium]|nr:nucleoside hydrolase [Candidatus Limnocylindrales bacterium]
MSDPAQRAVILDMDLGIDDAIALLYLASRPNVSIEAAGSVHGNTPADLAARNLRHVLGLAGLPDVPVARGAMRPLVRDAHFAGEVHGEDGLGNTLDAGSEVGGVQAPESAPEQIVRLARSAPGRYDILATGPLTNLAMALVLEPELPTLVRSVVIMGGSAAYGGNISAVAEANIWHDPEAAKLVFDAGWPLTMAGLDVTMPTMLDEAAIDRIAQGTSEHARFVTAILRHYLDFYEMISGRRACPLHDPTAAAVLADPSLITRALHGDVTVALGDDTRGQTIVDRRKDGGPWQPPQAGERTIVMEIDADRFVEDLVQTLLR